jgi:hypothetical protein
VAAAAVVVVALRPAEQEVLVVEAPVVAIQVKQEQVALQIQAAVAVDMAM